MMPIMSGRTAIGGALRFFGGAHRRRGCRVGIVKTRHLAPEGGGAEAAEGAHVAGEVRLVGVAEVEREASEALFARARQGRDEGLQAHDAPKERRVDADMLEKEALQLPLAEAELGREPGDPCPGGIAAHRLDGGAHLRVRGAGVGEAGVQLALDEGEASFGRGCLGEGLGEQRSAPARPELVEGRRAIAQRREPGGQEGRGAARPEAHPEQIDAAGQGEGERARHGPDELGGGVARRQMVVAQIEEQVSAAVGQHAVDRGLVRAPERPVAGDVAAQRLARGVFAVVHGGAARA